MASFFCSKWHSIDVKCSSSMASGGLRHHHHMVWTYSDEEVTLALVKNHLLISSEASHQIVGSRGHQLFSAFYFSHSHAVYLYSDIKQLTRYCYCTYCLKNNKQVDFLRSCCMINQIWYCPIHQIHLTKWVWFFFFRFNFWLN